MKILCFTFSDKLKEINIKKTDNIPGELSTIDTRCLKKTYTWQHENITLECYGCHENNNAEQINSHHLPPSENTYTLYGSIYLVYKINNTITDLDISQYGMLSFCIEERYESLDISENIHEISSDEEESEEVTNEKIKHKISPKKYKSKPDEGDILDELDYDNTNY